MVKTKQPTETRRPYSKPQLEQVQLVVEEAVLQGCKTSASLGPHGHGTYCQNHGGQWCHEAGS